MQQILKQNKTKQNQHNMYYCLAPTAQPPQQLAALSAEYLKFGSLEMVDLLFSSPPRSQQM